MSCCAVGVILMRTHIDWLTFTMPMLYREENDEAYAKAIESGFMDMFGANLVASVFGGNWAKEQRARAPYTDAWMDGERGVSLFASPNLTHSCVEISGQGCERIIEMGRMETVLARCGDRVTRIDIASDIETAVVPSDFVAQVGHERMRANGQQNSETGQTCYVGSKKSDRYARVYRYASPHPRAHLLRVEHVFRRKYAKKVAAAIVSGSLESVALAAGMAFGWKHSIWQPNNVESAEISVISERRNTGKTVFWLIHSCAAAFKRLCADGTIRDPEAFIKTYFLPENGIDA